MEAHQVSLVTYRIRARGNESETPRDHHNVVIFVTDADMRILYGERVKSDRAWRTKETEYAESLLGDGITRLVSMI